MLRIIAGVIFIAFALPKFLQPEFEIRKFVSYGLPPSSVLVYAVALAELGGGLALVAGLATRPAARLLAGDMAGAVLTAGVSVGGPIHLGLAPALLVTMLYLLWAGPGALSVDGRLDCRQAGTSRTR